MIDPNCTIECERMPECTDCGRRKKPVGRDAPLGSDYCDTDCAGYRDQPKAGHLWPGELAQLREEADE